MAILARGAAVFFKRGNFGSFAILPSAQTWGTVLKDWPEILRYFNLRAYEKMMHEFFDQYEPVSLVVFSGFVFFNWLFDSVSTAGLSSLDVPGVPWHTQILADQLTLFQPGGTDYVHLITTGTPIFSDLPTALKYVLINDLLFLSWFMTMIYCQRPSVKSKVIDSS